MKAAEITLDVTHDMNMAPRMKKMVFMLIFRRFQARLNYEILWDEFDFSFLLRRSQAIKKNKMATISKALRCLLSSLLSDSQPQLSLSSVILVKSNQNATFSLVKNSNRFGANELSAKISKPA